MKISKTFKEATLITLITVVIAVLSFNLYKHYIHTKLQANYHSLLQNVTALQENLFSFQFRNFNRYDELSELLVHTEIYAESLNHSIQKHFSETPYLVQPFDAAALEKSKTTELKLAAFVREMESLLSANVSLNYSGKTIDLLQNELYQQYTSVDERLVISTATQGGISDSLYLKDSALYQDPTYQSLLSYVQLQERVKHQLERKQVSLANLGVTEHLKQIDLYWEQKVSDTTKNIGVLILLLIIFVCTYALHRQKLAFTELLKMKQAMLESERQRASHALIAEHAKDAIIVTDPKGLVTWVNKGFEKLSGYSLTEMMGKKPGAVLQGKDTDGTQIKLLSEAIKCKQTIELTLLNYRKNGTAYWVDIIITPIFDDDGELSCFIAVERDTTKKVQLEKELELSAKRATVANEAKSTFLATMSHELRTPLNGILGMAQIMRGETTNSEHKEQLKVLLESGEHLTSLLNDILDFSKIEQNKLELDAVPFHFNQILTPIASTYQLLCDEKGIDLIIDNQIPDELVFLADISRIRQVIFNLMSNAVKFTAHGNVQLRCNCKLAEHNIYNLWVEIEDSGIGIAEDRLEHIFDPFIQAESSTTRNFGGTGLGLAIVKQLVELMGGQVKVSSEIDRGTCFTINISLEQTQDRPIELDQDETLTSTLPVGLNILIVEDNPVNALVTKKFCHTLDHQVTVAKDGIEAIECLQDQTFDVIIMDNHMPRLDGIETTKHIRNELKLNTVIFGCTADVFQEAHDRFINAGANYVLTKPLQKNSFNDALVEHKSLIEKHRSHSSKVVEMEHFTNSNESNSTSESEIDLSFYIDEVCAGDTEQLVEIISTLKESMLESIDALMVATESDDIESVTLHTHTMKGIASSLNANKMLAKSEQVFQIASKGNMPELSRLQELVNLLKVNADQTSRLLEEYVAEHPIEQTLPK
ncbi:putative TWO-COMPONENT SENSOR PROTEIN HISTIDINE PROTEIN KINASE (DHKK, DHKJ) [Vibrio nigripulchritudo MADA3029]|uniref:PAS domain-containing hybrid sensor histidine kinase/response regulator n=1 Tax=Vibrio nigripulchritudo TaxID=28173 RepID=UPI0003B1FBD2|nr:ATP-binding protein [Vibrio nigripulchritudo]CCN50436.1 putative TWO-COMPONENT SENSOR PROTEIN HISTIDINE PROTEIN KINASE (DHKK, DHKJ) [Vibrio nigripulchritudo MADA3020]CCN52387.1 putative TWO-COMPONENT SENSOR PROTEIN HISTIDINE PROTEIN KINASE (DHKK, DHKJ) [Vibrio nigripulchritudo MADA3021]CCN62214.1 putative TWO-COMPONENT SENSOR PROTEIN HISTIDINE PROTEIN KINASE (DHKK, DHKJ) [Vibrio nigripulchritudo MADA3029]